MVLLLVACSDDTPAPPPPDLLIGVWAADDGARVELALRENRVAGAVACEGRFAFDQWAPDFGSVGDWSHGSWDPLVLNLVDGTKRTRFAVWDVAPGGDTARMRVVSDADAARDPRALEAADTRVLTRQPSSPRPDAGDCPKPRLQP